MNRPPPTIEMRPDGTFVEQPMPGAVPLSAKLMLGAILVGAVAISVSIAALAIYVVSLLLPVIILAGAVAWVSFKYRRWQLFSRNSAARHRPGTGQPGGFRQ